MPRNRYAAPLAAMLRAQADRSKVPPVEPPIGPQTRRCYIFLFSLTFQPKSEPAPLLPFSVCRKYSFFSLAALNE
jgi:hypothetical protein